MQKNTDLFDVIGIGNKQLDNLPCAAALYEYDESGVKSVYFNSGYREMTGCAETIDISSSAFEAIHPDERELISREIVSAIQEKRNIEYDINILNGDGCCRPFHISASVKELIDGKHALLALYTPRLYKSGINEESAANAMMEKKLTFELDTLLKTIPSGILKYAADETEQFEYINRNFVESLGYTEESFKAKFHNCFRDMLWHEDREAAEEQVILQEGNGKIGKFNYRVEAADGQLRWIHDEGIKITDNDGKSWYYVTLVDITESHEAYAQLKLVTDSIPGGIATYVCTGKEIHVSYCNNGFCELFGVTREFFGESLKENPLSYVFSEDREKLMKQFNRLINTGSQIDCIYRIYVQTGGYKWVHHRAVISECKNDTVFINAVLFDITEQQKAQERLRVSEEVNRLAMEHSGRIVTQFDVSARTLTLPESLTPIFEVPHILQNVPEEQISLGRVSPETADIYRRLFYEIIEGKESGTATYRQKSTMGWRWLEAHSTTVFSNLKEPVSAVITFEDITEKLEKEVVYSKWQQSMANRPKNSYTLFRCNLSKNSFFDSCEGTLLDISFAENKQDFGELTSGYAERHVYHEDRERYLTFINSDTMLASYYRGHRADFIQYREIDSDGQLRWLQLSVELVEYPNSKDIEVYLMYENINESKLEELQTKEKAETDPLTGVLNRTTFAVRMGQIIGTSKPRDVHTLMMVDIDDFKKVNDTFGHEAGDQVLRDLTRQIRLKLRRDDLVGRLGGDEFFVFLKNIPDEAIAAAKAEQICGLNVRAGDSETVISVSVGIAMIPKDGCNFETLYKKVDAALYRKKAEGKNGYQFVEER